jgi:hypothetical protein
MEAFERITANGLWPAPRLSGGLEPFSAPGPKEDEVVMCARWIALHTEPAARINRKRTSYGLKHDVERWSKTLSESPFKQVDLHGRSWTAEYFYVSNGAFIEAAKRAGYRIARDGEGSPNAHFNMRFKDS